MKLLIPLLLCCAFLWITSCASQEPTQPQKQVVCKYWLQQCHLKARKHCPSGYSVNRSVRVDKVGGPHGTYREYKMIFYCN